MKQKATHIRLVLIPAGKTEWNGQDRLQGSADLPLSTAGVEQVSQWIEQLVPLNIEHIHSSPLDPAAETAKLIAKAFKIKWRSLKDLDEANLGLWQGMGLAEFKQKHPKVYKQWLEQPDGVTPPDGESLKTVRERLERALAKLVAGSKAQCTAVVLGELALGLTRLLREDRGMDAFWELTKEPPTWHEYLIEYDNRDDIALDRAEQGDDSGSVER